MIEMAAQSVGAAIEEAVRLRIIGRCRGPLTELFYLGSRGGLGMPLRFMSKAFTFVIAPRFCNS